MKKTSRLLLPLLIGLTLLAAPTLALAQTGPVHQVLAGTVFDPAATNLRIVPPKGGMVLVYRDGKAVGWLMRAGYITVRPNRVYGVVATRGTSVLFNAGLMVRPGMTELVWNGGDQPQVSYLPAYYLSGYPGYGGQPYGNSHHGHDGRQRDAERARKAKSAPARSGEATPAKPTQQRAPIRAASRMKPTSLEAVKAATVHKAKVNDRPAESAPRADH